jgi:hypothetical protein
MRRLPIVVICAVSLTGCGIGQSATKATTVPPPKATTTTVPPATVDVQPVSGPIGTSFQLAGTRFQSGEMVTFQIVFPDTKSFKGPAHTASAVGAVTAVFRVTTGNPLGKYQVTAVGDKGTQATGAFDVTAGAAPTTTIAAHATTTLATHPTTTVSAHTTTTLAGRTATTTKP